MVGMIISRAYIYHILGDKKQLQRKNFRQALTLKGVSLPNKKIHQKAPSEKSRGASIYNQIWLSSHSSEPFFTQVDLLISSNRFRNNLGHHFTASV